MRHPRTNFFAKYQLLRKVVALRLSQVIEMAPSSQWLWRWILWDIKLWFSKQKSKNVFGYIIMVLKKPTNSSNNHLQNHLFLFSSFIKTTNSSMLYKGNSMLYNCDKLCVCVTQIHWTSTPAFFRLAIFHQILKLQKRIDI